MSGLFVTRLILTSGGEERYDYIVLNKTTGLFAEGDCELSSLTELFEETIKLYDDCPSIDGERHDKDLMIPVELIFNTEKCYQLRRELDVGTES